MGSKTYELAQVAFLRGLWAAREEVIIYRKKFHHFVEPLDPEDDGAVIEETVEDDIDVLDAVANVFSSMQAHFVKIKDNGKDPFTNLSVVLKSAGENLKVFVKDHPDLQISSHDLIKSGTGSIASCFICGQFFIKKRKDQKACSSDCSRKLGQPKSDERRKEYLRTYRAYQRLTSKGKDHDEAIAILQEDIRYRDTVKKYGENW